MKNVLVFGLGDNLGGVESVIYNYYSNIDKNKVNIDFLTNTENVVHEKEILDNNSKIFKICAKSKNYFKYKKDLKRFFKENGKKYDIIWINICLLSNIDYLIYAKKYGIKTRIIHCHNSKNMGSFYNKVFHIFNKLRIKKYATDFWSCSNEASEFFYNDKIIKSNHYCLINNAINLDEYKYDINRRNNIRKKMDWENRVIIGNVGRLHFQKNQTFAIKIFKEIKKIIPNAFLVLIGDGEDKDKLKNIIDAENISTSVQFLGMRSDVKDLLQGIDIFLFPSLFEGLSIALVEAQASNLLIFTSTNVSLETKMCDNIYFEDLSLSPKYWASKICNIYDNYDRKNATNYIAEKGFDIILEAKKLEKKFLEM